MNQYYRKGKRRRFILLLSVLSLLLWESKYHSLLSIPSLTPQYSEGEAGIKDLITVRAEDSDEFICSAGVNNSELSSLSDFSPYLRQAIIASEDSRFDWHFGIDPIGITRAVARRLLGGSLEGGSTITQQVSRTVYREKVGDDDSIKRKLREAFYALGLEFFYSKDEILKVYLNRVFLGGDNYGFEAASRAYFGKSAAFLNIQEAATLVSIMPAPNSYVLENAESQENVDNALARRDRIINRMASLGFINTNQKDKALRKGPIFFSSDSITRSFSTEVSKHFCNYVIDSELPRIIGSQTAFQGGVVVTTSLDFDAQKIAEEELIKSISSEGASKQFSQGALISLDSRTGEIIAMVGGVDDGDLNRTISSYRQPGSTFKIFTYLAAIEKSISLQEQESCSELVWEGQTYNPCERSKNEPRISLYDGFVWSENVVALRLAKKIGLETVVDTACRLGIRFDEDVSQKESCNNLLRDTVSPGIVLGEKEVRLIDIASSYAILNNKGKLNFPHAVRKVVDATDCAAPRNYRTCRVIYPSTSNSAYPVKQDQVIDPEVVSQMQPMLMDAIKVGTGQSAYIGLGESGKTGTTDNGVDLWFIGYVPDGGLTTAIWLGNDDNSPSSGSSRDAAELWGRYTRKISRYIE